MAHRVADGACRICDGVHGRSRHTAYLRRCTGPSTAHVVRARTWPSMAHSAANDARRTCAYAAIYDKTTFEEAERRFYEANYRLMLYVRAERVPAWRCWFIRKRCMDKFCEKITKIRHTSTGNKKRHEHIMLFWIVVRVSTFTKKEAENGARRTQEGVGTRRVKWNGI